MVQSTWWMKIEACTYNDELVERMDENRWSRRRNLESPG